MAKQDQITKRTKRVANNVSHSKRRTKRTQELNLQYKRFYIPEENRWVRLRVSARTMRSIAKVGLLAFARKHNVQLSKGNRKIDQKVAPA